MVSILKIIAAISIIIAVGTILETAGVTNFSKDKIQEPEMADEIAKAIGEWNVKIVSKTGQVDEAEFNVKVPTEADGYISPLLGAWCTPDEQCAAYYGGVYVPMGWYWCNGVALQEPSGSCFGPTDMGSSIFFGDGDLKIVVISFPLEPLDFIPMETCNDYVNVMKQYQGMVLYNTLNERDVWTNADESLFIICSQSGKAATWIPGFFKNAIDEYFKKIVGVEKKSVQQMAPQYKSHIIKGRIFIDGQPLEVGTVIFYNPENANEIIVERTFKQGFYDFDIAFLPSGWKVGDVGILEIQIGTQKFQKTVILNNLPMQVEDIILFGG